MSIFYSDRYDEYGVPLEQKKFKIRMQDLNRSPATKSGRPLKPDAVPGAIVEYLNAYRIATQAIHARHPPQYQLAQKISPGLYSTPGVSTYYARGGGRGGGNTQKDSSGNCGIHSMWWWGSDILDTGTPPGAPSQAMGNPAPLVNMLNIYPKYNIIFDKGTCYSVEADNGIAKGARKPVPCSVFNHQLGFGFSNMQAKLDYRRLWQTTQWAADALGALFQGAPMEVAATMGFARGGGGGGRGGGGNNGGQRMIQATIAGKSQSIAIDTGTDAILGAGNGNKQCSFDPNPQTISVPSTSHSQANYYYVPAYSISQAIKICLTNEYTVCQSYGQGGTIAYHWSSGNTKQQGDPYNGKEWGEGNVQSTPLPAQQKNQPSYTQPIAKPEGQQNQYFNKNNKKGWGYRWEEDDLLL